MLRDNGREDIFIDEEDKRVIKGFINYDNEYKEKSFPEMEKIQK